MNPLLQRLRLPLLVLLTLLAAACSRPAPRLPKPLERPAPWSKECVDELARVPLQQNGRVKPLSVWAAFTLYSVHGRRDLKFEVSGDGGVQKITLEPIEWLLDVWCYPNQADDYPLFRIENVAVLDALEIANEGQKQGFEFLSFNQAVAAVKKLEELGRKYSGMNSGERSEVEEHLVQLWNHFRAYDNLRSTMDLLRFPIAVPDARMQEVLGGDRVMLAELVSKGPAFKQRLTEIGDAAVNDDALVNMLELLQRMFRFNMGEALVPPLAAATPSVGDPEWLFIGAVAEADAARS